MREFLSHIFFIYLILYISIFSVIYCANSISCLILIYLISEGLPEQHLGDVRGQHRPKARHARAAAHSYRAQGGRVDFGCVLKEQKRELNMISK